MLKKAIQGDLDAAFALAKQAYKAKDFHLARKYFDKVVIGPSRNWIQASLYVGTIDFNAGHYQGAEHYWKQAADNGESTAMFNLGVLNKKLENISGALFWYEKAWLKGHASAKRSLDQLKKMPSPQYNLTARDAELIAAQWMVYWGYYDAKATPIGPDGGIDVIASRALAQVKHRNVKTSRTEINEFHGSAEGSGKDELYFSLSGYTQQALERADEKSIALFIFNSEGIPKPVNGPARRIASK